MIQVPEGIMFWVTRSEFSLLTIDSEAKIRCTFNIEFATVCFGSPGGVLLEAPVSNWSR